MQQITIGQIANIRLLFTKLISVAEDLNSQRSRFGLTGQLTKSWELKSVNQSEAVVANVRLFPELKSVDDWLPQRLKSVALSTRIQTFG